MSVSSIRRMNVPPRPRAMSQLNNAVRALPTCRLPVGLGAPADVAEADAGSFAERILVPDLGDDERDEAISPKPELFVQTRYHANPIDEAEPLLTTARRPLRPVLWAGVALVLRAFR